MRIDLGLQKVIVGLELQIGQVLLLYKGLLKPFYHLSVGIGKGPDLVNAVFDLDRLLQIVKIHMLHPLAELIDRLRHLL